MAAEDVVAGDHTSVLGDLADATGDRTAIPIPVAAISRCVQVCGVDAHEETIAGLADNIGEFGLTHPVEVMPNSDGTWTLVKGNGRLLAHRRLGRPTILAFVDPRRLDEDTLAEVIQTQASENAHRKQLTILETLNTIDRLASPPCNRSRNEIGRIMHLPETTLKRHWRIYRAIRDRRPQWHPAVAAWLNTAEATWKQAAAFAADPASQDAFAATGILPGSTTAVPESVAAADPAKESAEPGPPEAGPGRTPVAREEPGGQGGPIGPPSEPTAAGSEGFHALWDRLGAVLHDLARIREDLSAVRRSQVHALLINEAAHWCAASLEGPPP